jgi:hypothetical protein
MTLFVSTNAQEPMVGLDLVHILGTDSGGLGTPSSGGAFDQASYKQTQNSFAKDRMNAIINSFAQTPINVTGVLNTFVLPDGTPITSAAGVTSVPSSSVNSAGTGVASGTTITIIYDVSACGGSGYCVFDTSNNSISDPTEVILFHELAHAFHWANNDFDKAKPEPQAENDENKLRGEEQPPVPLRDPNNHNGGCGTCTPPKSCFIASAAFGSALAPEVDEFRKVRDSILRQTRLGAEFFSHFYAEYNRFSRRVAGDMNASPALRETMTVLLVEPMLEFLRLLQDYAWGRWQDAKFARDVAISLERSLVRLRQQDFVGQWEVEQIADGIAQMGCMNAEPQAWPRQDRPPRPPADPRDPVALFDYINSLVFATSDSTKYVEWGLVLPLKLYWSAMRAWQAEDAYDIGAAATYVNRTANWLASVPIPPTLNYPSREALRIELAQLAKTVFTTPSIRRYFGGRLLTALDGSVEFDLRELLSATAYL